MWAEKQQPLSVNQELECGHGIDENVLGLVQALNHAKAERPIAEELILGDAINALPDVPFIQGLRVLLQLVYVPIAQQIEHLLKFLGPLVRYAWVQLLIVVDWNGLIIDFTNSLRLVCHCGALVFLARLLLDLAEQTVNQRCVFTSSAVGSGAVELEVAGVAVP